MFRTLLLMAPALLAACFLGCRTDVDTPATHAPAYGTEPLQLTAANFEKEVLQSELPVMVDVYAVWCGPCKRLAPVIAEVAADFEGRAVVAKLDGEEQRAIADRYQIRGYPTLLFFRDGKIVDRMGPGSKQEIAKRLQAISS